MIRSQMQRLPLFLLLVTLFALSCSVGCHSPELKEPFKTNTSATCLCGQTNWTKFTSPDGGFSILMPSTPELKTHNFLHPKKVSSNMWTSSPARVLAYSVETLDYPHDFLAAYKEKVLELLVQVSSKQGGRTLIAKQRVRHHKYPGLDWIITAEGGKALIAQRAYLVKERVYVIMYVTPGARFCTTHAAAFFNSFAVENPDVRAP